MADPAVLLGAAVLAAASAALGLMLRAHPALALVGAMVWSAALAAGLEAVGNGAQGRNASVVVAAAGIAVGIEAARRAREERPREAAPAPAQPALQPSGRHATVS
jgi:hypothetical protein